MVALFLAYFIISAMLMAIWIDQRIGKRPTTMASVAVGILVTQFGVLLNALAFDPYTILAFGWLSVIVISMGGVWVVRWAVDHLSDPTKPL